MNKRLWLSNNRPLLNHVLEARDKFWSHVKKPEDSTACWLWTGTTHHTDGSALWLFNLGRGARTARYRIQAQRAVLMLNGVELKDDDVVYRKTCRNVLCVNPEHLGIGGHEANVAARHAAGNTARGVENGRAKLTENDVAEIKLQLRRGVPKKVLAEHYAVDKRAIWGIENGRVWKHVEAKPE